MGEVNSYDGSDLQDGLVHMLLSCYVDLVDDDGEYVTVIGGECNAHAKMQLLEAYMLLVEDASSHTPDADVYINGAKAADISASSGQALGTRSAGTLVNAECLCERNEVVNILVTADSATTGQAVVFMHFVVVE